MKQNHRHSWRNEVSIVDEEGDKVIYDTCNHCPCKRVSMDLNGKKMIMFYKFSGRLFDTWDRPLCVKTDF